MDGTSLCKLAYVLVYSSNGGKTKLTNKLVLTQRRTAMPAEFQRLNKLIIFWLRINALHFSLSLPALRLRSSVRCKRKGRHNNHRQADNLTEKVNHFDK